MRGRRRKARRRGLLSWQGSLAPLLDVLFLLLIFLLVSASFDERRVLEVNLPEAKSGDPVAEVPESQQRIILLAADGSLQFNGLPTTASELLEFLAGRPEADRLLPVQIQGDAGAPLGAGLGLLDGLRAIGYRDCAFEVLPATDR